MALSQKTTLLLTPEMHARLRRLARLRGTSMGELIRAAVDQQYSEPSAEDRLAMVEELGGLGLPVASPAELKAQSMGYSLEEPP